jgi:hypothetical protein
MFHDIFDNILASHFIDQQPSIPLQLFTMVVVSILVNLFCDILKHAFSCGMILFVIIANIFAFIIIKDIELKQIYKDFVNDKIMF